MTRQGRSWAFMDEAARKEYWASLALRHCRGLGARSAARLARHFGSAYAAVQARSQWGEAKTPEQKAGIASMLEGAMGRLMVVVENYPELKANENFIRLQDELAGTENRINVERQRYNTAVQGYNVAIRKMPRGFFARLFGFETRTPFEAAQGAETAPTVQF